MSLRVVVQDETGKPVTTPADLSVGWLPDTDDDRFLLLRFVDEYGDTVFNRLQIPVLLQDLEVLDGLVENEVAHQHIAHLKSMGQACLATPHLYLKFIGD